MNDQELFLEATKEVLSPERNKKLWVKALSIASGDREKAKDFYVKMRVEQLKNHQEESKAFEVEKATNSKEKVQEKNSRAKVKKENSRGPLLLEVTKSFALFENVFVYEGTDYSYEGVSSVHYGASVNEINLINVGSRAYMSIRHDDCCDISVDAETWVLKTQHFKNIGRAANIVSQKTFRGRLGRNIKKLETQGYISIPRLKFRRGGGVDEWEIRIYGNGDVVEKDLRFNLHQAHAQKCLQIGYDAHLGYEGVSNPYEVIVSDTGTAFWNTKIKFDITTDYDVMSWLLKSLAGIDQ